MGANNSELAMIGQFGPAKAYAVTGASYTLIGPLPRGWYTIVGLSHATRISPQGDATIATQMDSDDASSVTYDANSLDRFCVNFQASDTIPRFIPDDRYIAVKRDTPGLGTIKLRVMRIGVTLP